MTYNWHRPPSAWERHRGKLLILGLVALFATVFGAGPFL